MSFDDSGALGHVSRGLGNPWGRPEEKKKKNISEFHEEVQEEDLDFGNKSLEVDSTDREHFDLNHQEHSEVESDLGSEGERHDSFEKIGDDVNRVKRPSLRL